MNERVARVIVEAIQDAIRVCGGPPKHKLMKPGECCAGCGYQRERKIGTKAKSKRKEL